MGRPKRADDKRRTYHKVGVDSEESETGHAEKRVANVYHDRRNGSGKRAK